MYISQMIHKTTGQFSLKFKKMLFKVYFSSDFALF